MPATLAQLRAVSKPLAVTYEGLTINFAYAPGKYTPAFEQSLNAGDEAGRAAFLPALLAGLLTDWDILTDDGAAKAELSAATLSDLGYPFLNKVATDLIKDLSPGEVTAPNSGSF
jgi:hypothetical protein